MQVREGMTQVVAQVGPEHSLREAARLMTQRGCGSAVVLMDESPGPGIVTERDVLVSLGRGQDPDSERVRDHMSDAPLTAAPDWSLERAAASMSKRGIRHLLVVEGGDVIGILSMRDIIRVWMTDGATSDMDALAT